VESSDDDLGCILFVGLICVTFGRFCICGEELRYWSSWFLHAGTEMSPNFCHDFFCYCFLAILFYPCKRTVEENNKNLRFKENKYLKK
jgi:hypothetical protein